MRALVFDPTAHPKSPVPGLSVATISYPENSENSDEALIRVISAGICNTDLEIVKGYMGFVGVPGHEFVGIVEKAPDSSWVDKRVVGEINAGCGVCPLCLSGDSRHCADRTVLGILGRNGAFAQYLSLPPVNLRQVPDSVSNDAALFVEPLAAACEIAEQVDLAGLRTLIVGDGKLAQLIARVLPCFDADCTLVAKHESKAKMVPKPCKTILLRDYTPEKSYDVVVEASGRPEGFTIALNSCKPGGAFVLKSTYAGSFDFNPAPLVIDEIKLIGSRCGRFDMALPLLESGAVDPTDLISVRFDLEHGVEAFEKAMQPDSFKIMLGISE